MSKYVWQEYSTSSREQSIDRAVARLKEIDPILSDDIKQTVLLRDPPRPYICTRTLERSRLANTLERIVHNGFDR